MDVARFARQIALPEVGPEGQQRLGACRVVVVGDDLAAEMAARYLTAAGLGTVVRVARGADDWRATLADADVVVRSGFDDDGLLGVAARLGLPAVIVRAQREQVDLMSFPKRPREPEAALARGAEAAPPPQLIAGGAEPSEGSARQISAAVLAGTLAAAEAIWTLLRPAGDAVNAIRHVRLPLDGGDPLAQEIGRPSP